MKKLYFLIQNVHERDIERVFPLSEITHLESVDPPTGDELGIEGYNKCVILQGLVPDELPADLILDIARLAQDSCGYIPLAAAPPLTTPPQNAEPKESPTMQNLCNIIVRQARWTGRIKRNSDQNSAKKEHSGQVAAPAEEEKKKKPDRKELARQLKEMYEEAVAAEPELFASLEENEPKMFKPTEPETEPEPAETIDIAGFLKM